MHNRSAYNVFADSPLRSKISQLVEILYIDPKYLSNLVCAKLELLCETWANFGMKFTTHDSGEYQK